MSFHVLAITVLAILALTVPVVGLTWYSLRVGGHRPPVLEDERVEGGTN